MEGNVKQSVVMVPSMKKLFCLLLYLMCDVRIPQVWITWCHLCLVFILFCFSSGTSHPPQKTCEVSPKLPADTIPEFACRSGLHRCGWTCHVLGLATLGHHRCGMQPCLGVYYSIGIFFREPHGRVGGKNKKHIKICKGIGKSIRKPNFFFEGGCILDWISTLWSDFNGFINKHVTDKLTEHIYLGGQNLGGSWADYSLFIFDGHFCFGRNPIRKRNSIPPIFLVWVWGTCFLYSPE